MNSEREKMEKTGICDLVRSVWIKNLKQWNMEMWWKLDLCYSGQDPIYHKIIIWLVCFKFLAFSSYLIVQWIYKRRQVWEWVKSDCTMSCSIRLFVHLLDAKTKDEILIKSKMIEYFKMVFGNVMIWLL